jgi:hypothetical protein
MLQKKTCQLPAFCITILSCVDDQHEYNYAYLYCGFLGYNTVQSDRCLPTFRRHILPAFSEYKEALCLYETSVTTYHAAICHHPQDRSMNIRRPENFKPNICLLYLRLFVDQRSQAPNTYE